jgi:hypothetical protein
LSYGFAPASVVAPLGTVVSPQITYGSRVSSSHPGIDSELLVRPIDPAGTLPYQRVTWDGLGSSWGYHGRLFLQPKQPKGESDPYRDSKSHSNAHLL